MIRLTPEKATGTVKVTFALPASRPLGRCSVVGDFNDWRPGTHELRKRANGTCSVAIRVRPGTRIQFRYLAENDCWLNDPDVTDREGLNSVLVV